MGFPARKQIRDKPEPLSDFSPLLRLFRIARAIQVGILLARFDVAARLLHERLR